MKPKSLLRILAAVLLIILIQSCSVFRTNHTKQQKLFPEILKELYFGMSYEEFTKIRTDAVMSYNQDFRTVYMEELTNQDITDIIYYFTTGNKPFLYEIIVIYKNEIARDAAATQLLGDPNFNDEEWRFKSGEGFYIHAWKYQTKLIWAGKMKGTEWEDHEF